MVSIVGERKVSGRGGLRIGAIKVRPSTGTAYQSRFIQANQKGQEATVGDISPPFCSVFPKTILILTTYGLLEAEVRTTPFGIRSPGLVAHHLILLSLCVFHLEKGVKVGNQSSSWGYCESLMRSFSKGLAHHLAYKTVQYN